MTTKQLEDIAKEKYPFIFRNNRGQIKTDKGFIRYGIPEPAGKKELYKGGDFIGFIETEITEDMIGKKVAIFLNVEIKGDGDTLKDGQKRWHNFVIEHGGISEIIFSERIINERMA